MYVLQKKVKLRFYFCVAVDAFCDDFFSASRFEFPHLAVYVLPLFFSKRAAGETVILAHDVLSLL